MTREGIDPYVQRWSEARGNVIIEVGRSDRPDPKLQAFADAIRPALLDRGFEIGGNRNNFRKELALLSGAEAGRFAREMIAIGVTPNHIRHQMFGFLERVRKLSA